MLSRTLLGWFLAAFVVAVSAPSAAHQLTRIPIPTPNAGVSGLAVDYLGNVWFAESNANKIGRIYSAGTLAHPTWEVTEFSIPTADSRPTAMAPFVSTVYFTEAAANKIGTISPDGVITETPISTADAGAAGIAEGLDMWFTEFRANKVAEVGGGEYPVPTLDSGPSEISLGPSQFEMAFTERNANKIGVISILTHEFREIDIPTADSVPSGVAVDGSDGTIWFTEYSGNKIGRIDSSGAITEFPIPTAASGPTVIMTDYSSQTSFPTGVIWFLEKDARQVGRIEPDGTITEIPLPPDSSPQGMVPGYNGLWISDAGTNSILFVSADVLIVGGAGNVGSWETRFDLANGKHYASDVSAELTPYSFEGCPLICPLGAEVLVPAGGSSSLLASDLGGPFGPTNVFIGSNNDLDLPTVTARVYKSTDPTRGAELPTILLAHLVRLDPSAWLFPGASRDGGSHANLMISECSAEEYMSVTVDVLDASGTRLASQVFPVPDGTSVLLVDVLERLGVPSLENGQIRVTKIGTTGLLWGVMSTLSADGSFTVTAGSRP